MFSMTDRNQGYESQDNWRPDTLRIHGRCVNQKYDCLQAVERLIRLENAVGEIRNSEWRTKEWKCLVGFQKNSHQRSPINLIFHGGRCTNWDCWFRICEKVIITPYMRGTHIVSDWISDTNFPHDATENLHSLDIRSDHTTNHFGWDRLMKETR
jgi:hypothetical protein